MQTAALESGRQLRHFAGFTVARQTEAQHRIDFIILNVQQRAGAREFRQQTHPRRAKQRRHHADKREKAAEGKAAQMQ